MRPQAHVSTRRARRDGAWTKLLLEPHCSIQAPLQTGRYSLALNYEYNTGCEAGRSRSHVNACAMESCVVKVL